MPDPRNLPIPVIDPNMQFHASTEINEYGLTAEIEEFYDGKNNIGISVSTAGGSKITTYSYYDINHLLIVKGN